MEAKQPTTEQQFPGPDALQVEGALEWAYRHGYVDAEKAADAYGRMTGRLPSKRDLGQYGDTLEFKGNPIGPELLEALQAVQLALAAMRDDKPYIHPIHGELNLEEVKYCVVDPAIARATGGEQIPDNQGC